MNNDSVFVIEFHTKSESPLISVWSDDLNTINTFIKQHSFDESTIRKYVIPGCDIEKHHDILQTDNMLIIKKFKSNSSSEIFNVVTTDEFLDQITQCIGDDLVDALMFGGAILRSDLKFIENICDGIESLEYASICDFELISNDIIDQYYSTDSQDDEFPKYPPPADTSYIYDTLYHARSNHDILPFTIEAYVHYFITDIMEVLI